MGFDVHRGTRFYTESFVVTIEVRYDPIASVLAWRMRIGFDPLTHLGFSILAAPNLPPPDEEPLLSGIPVDHWRFGLAERKLVSGIGYTQSTQVTDVLAKGELAI